MSGDVVPGHHGSFEALRHLDADGNEYWLARELMPVLEYETWRNFKAVIAKARTAVEQVDLPANEHFAEVDNMVLSRCIVQRPNATGEANGRGH